MNKSKSTCKSYKYTCINKCVSLNIVKLKVTYDKCKEYQTSDQDRKNGRKEKQVHEKQFHVQLL